MTRLLHMTHRAFFKKFFIKQIFIFFENYLSHHYHTLSLCIITIQYTYNNAIVTSMPQRHHYVIMSPDNRTVITIINAGLPKEASATSLSK